MAILRSARTLHDLKGPGLHLEALKGDRAGQHSIRVSDRWRICFDWRDGPNPGETLKDEYLVPLDMNVAALARELGIGAARWNEIVRGRRDVTADTALRLARYFGTTTEFWLNLQAFYDLRMAQRKAGRSIERQVKPRRAA